MILLMISPPKHLKNTIYAKIIVEIDHNHFGFNLMRQQNKTTNLIGVNLHYFKTILNTLKYNINKNNRKDKA